MTDRDQLHALVDELADAEVRPALRFLEFLAERGAPPALRALALAPEDDEPTTEEDRAALTEGREDLDAGRTIPHEELVRELFGEPRTGGRSAPRRRTRKPDGETA